MNSSRSSLAVIAAASAAAAIACAPAVRSDRDESIPVPRGATWAWNTPAAPDDEIFVQRFRRAAETTMDTKGFHRVEDASQAEFLLTVNMGPGGARRAAYRGYGGPYQGAYGESRLVVLLRQRSSGDVAWRATYVMDIYDMRSTSQASVQKIADKLLKDLR